MTHTHPFLITSIGRTATKWLAQCLCVPHEPTVFRGYAVSPAHLHRMAVEGWQLPEDVSVGIITRDARDQILSVINRWHALGGAKMREQSWRRMLPGYLAHCEKLFRAGAHVMHYADLTCCRECQRRVLDPMDVAALQWVDKPSNQFRATILTLPPWAERLAVGLQEAYDRWHRDRGTSSPTGDGDSRTTTCSRQRSRLSEPIEPDSSRRP